MSDHTVRIAAVQMRMGSPAENLEKHVAFIARAAAERARIVLFGGSCICNPTGRIVADADVSEGLIMHDCDLDLVRQVREYRLCTGARLPTLASPQRLQRRHRRLESRALLHALLLLSNT